MSRIGKQPVPVPAGVDVTIDGQNVSVKGPKGTLDLAVAEPITCRRDDDGAIVVTRPDDERRNRSLHGLSRTLVANLVTGVTEGYTTKMEIFGVGYRVAAQGQHPRVRARLQPSGADRGARRASPSRWRRPPSSRSPVSTSRRSARSRRTSAACAARTRTRARAFATRVSRSAARSERQVSRHGSTRNRRQRPSVSRWGRASSAARRVSRLRRHARLRKKIAGTAERPRLVVNRSVAAHPRAAGRTT